MIDGKTFRVVIKSSNQSCVMCGATSSLENFNWSKFQENFVAQSPLAKQSVLGEEEIGDSTPSQFLRRLQSLAGNTIVQDSMMKTVWLQRLPTSAQVILRTQPEDTSLDQLAKMADRIVEAVPTKPNSSVFSMSTADSDSYNFRTNIRNSAAYQNSFHARSSCTLKTFTSFSPLSRRSTLENGNIAGKDF
ncbi:unnamed protein product [Bemisia tabaci]|uniref:Uncharacterized protein n=1 Tax=Bemisia tabaci TaxID=7038 RepID=A0A9P0F3N8_BEMTA|nr:unnamed protein product [Bemisia tabaci]